MRRIIYSICLFLVVSACNNKQDDLKLFTELSSDDTGIEFKNLVRETEEFNVLTYGYFHQGGGVAIGDINNDSLPDVFFTGNMMASKLYINKGDWKFEDVSESAGVRAAGLWNTGTTMADVNGDGWLDIYICRSAANDPRARRNLLFINNQDLTFTEQAASYGLDDSGYSTQASFFDYDGDGDLDMFSLNHSTQEFAGFSRVTGEFKQRTDAKLGSKLFRNDGEKFTDVTEEAGIINNVLGFGLGVTISDLNNDHWPDIYISNDYNEEDYFYINQQNGTFREALDEFFGHVSFFSMGADAADLNNDLRPDIITLDMLPEDSYNQKKIMGPENYEKYRELLSEGFFPQTMRNMLHLNQGNFFSEIGQLAGVSNTDWSWSVLAADYDNDGWKDLMVTNGYMRNYLDMDFLTYMVSEQVKKKEGSRDGALLELINKMPPIEVRNYLYKNNGDLTFEKMSEEWGFDRNTVSNSAAYGDLDNDGDLDLIICHTNAEASIFRNNSEALTKNHYLKVKLRGSDKNGFAVGTKVILHYGSTSQQQELIPVRGFQSSVNYELVFGLGGTNTIDSLEVIWPNRLVQTVNNIEADQTLVLSQQDATLPARLPARPNAIFVADESRLDISFVETKSTLLDFKRDRMIPNNISNSGPRIIQGDVDGDGRSDLFIAGAKGSKNRLYRQVSSGKFVLLPESALPDNGAVNDKDAIFLDADGDGDEDLYIVSGGSEFQEDAPELQDRLLFNDGRGNFKQKVDALPKMLTNSCSVTSGDFNNDGHIDVFVGGRSIPGRYPVAPRSYLLQNRGDGTFEDVTSDFCQDLVNPGMVTTSRFVDVNGDEFPDLIVAGEWMPVRIFVNEGGQRLTEKRGAINQESAGWWLSMEANDFDDDGDVDFVFGNFGLNNPYHVNAQHPARLLYKDFDNNGSIDPIFSYYIDDTVSFAYSRDELIGQIPGMKKKFVDYKSFASMRFQDYFTQEQLMGSDTLTARLLESVYLKNDGEGNFDLIKLPVEAQFAPVFALASADINADGHLDIITGGNFTQSRVSVGPCDANYGIVFLGDGNGKFSAINPMRSGLSIRGDVRDLKVIDVNGVQYLIAARNGDSLEVYRISTEGLRSSSLARSASGR